jgi:maltooligosyltrehalose trehalohydrolase
VSRRCHDMPFGAQVTDYGVRFRLWAPAATTVDLVLADGRRMTMKGAKDGFFECYVDGLEAGSGYGFSIDGDQALLADPASRCNPRGVHALSEVVDPGSFGWTDEAWRGRPWEEAVIYEVHVGAFTETGNFAGVAERLPYLAELGVTALELMPVAEFSGRRGWGYDGVLPFAPESSYGRPDDLKRLVEAAHGEGLMVLLDVVYNHFGPDGNYLHRYAPQFFTGRVQTPWGQAIEFEGERGRTVREFFIHNSLYWLEEFHVDGLRLDAVHAIHDRSQPDIVEELADRVRAAVPDHRLVHLVLENDDNAARYLRAPTAARGNRRADGLSQKRRPHRYDAQWNDDFHHAAHVLLTGETRGYYEDYEDDPLELLGRTLTEGFAYQGEWSRHRQRHRGESSTGLPSSAFIAFLQNHDHVGNRAFGERLASLVPEKALPAAETLLLLAPHQPLLFMGEEFAASSRFPFFCDFHDELAVKVAEGRRREFEHFPEFSDPAARDRIPDPNAPATFDQARLPWQELAEGRHALTLERYRHLLAVRHKQLTPRLPAVEGQVQRLGERALWATWRLAGDAHWHMLANLGGDEAHVTPPAGRCVWASFPIPAGPGPWQLPNWSAAAVLEL